MKLSDTELEQRVALAKHIAEKTVRCDWADKNKQSDDIVLARQTTLVHALPRSTDSGTPTPAPHNYHHIYPTH